jgi:xanthine/uracil permease
LLTFNPGYHHGTLRFSSLEADLPAAESGVVAPDERLSAGQTLVMGVQHAVAMFGATVLMPLLMGLDPTCRF